MLIRFFVSGVTWSVRASSVALGLKHVVSLELLRDVTGKLSSHLPSLSSLFCDVTALLSFEFDLDGWFSRCQGQSPADWLSGRPCTEG